MKAVPINMKKPNKFSFNPSTIINLSVMGNPTQLNLKIVNRYCDLDIKNKLVDFYLEVSNGKLSFVIPVKFYEFICASQTDNIVCDYYKLKDNNGVVNYVEIASFDKPVIEILPDVPNQLRPDCNMISEGYLHQYSSSTLSASKVLSVGDSRIATGYTITTILDGVYVRAMTSLKYLLDTRKQKIFYRKILLNGEIFITDVEARI